MWLWETDEQEVVSSNLADGNFLFVSGIVLFGKSVNKLKGRLDRTKDRRSEEKKTKLLMKRYFAKSYLCFMIPIGCVCGMQGKSQHSPQVEPGA